MDDLRKLVLEKYLDMWARHMNDNASELRPLWYKDRSIGTYERLTVDRDGDEDIDGRALEVMKGAIASLTPNQQIAIELDQGLRSVDDINDREDRLGEALQIIWCALVAHGVFSGVSA